MKENRNKGVIRFIIGGLIFLLIGGLVGGFYALNSGAENLYERGKRFDPYQNDSPTSIKITGILTEPIAEVDTGTFIYLVEYEGSGYVGLEASAGDKKLQALLDQADTLREQPMILEVKVFSTSSKEDGQIENYESLMSGIIDRSSDIAPAFAYGSYVSLSEANALRWLMYGTSAFLIGIGFILFARAYSIHKTNNQSYDNLYQTYPELQGNLDLLLVDAAYRNERLQILVYKEHLVTYYRGFNAVALPDVERLYGQTIRHRYSLFTVARDEYLMVHRTGIKRPLTMQYKSAKKETDMELQSLLDYVANSYPEIQIGF